MGFIFVDFFDIFLMNYEIKFFYLYFIVLIYECFGMC